MSVDVCWYLKTEGCFLNFLFASSLFPSPCLLRMVHKKPGVDCWQAYMCKASVSSPFLHFHFITSTNSPSHLPSRVTFAFTFTSKKVALSKPGLYTAILRKVTNWNFGAGFGSRARLDSCDVWSYLSYEFGDFSYINKLILVFLSPVFSMLLVCTRFLYLKNAIDPISSSILLLFQTHTRVLMKQLIMRKIRKQTAK